MTSKLILFRTYSLFHLLCKSKDRKIVERTYLMLVQLYYIFSFIMEYTKALLSESRNLSRYRWKMLSDNLYVHLPFRNESNS